MTNTKRIIAIALALVFIVSAFTACAHKDEPTQKPDTSTSTTVKPTEKETEATVPAVGDETEETEATSATETTTAAPETTTKKQTQTPQTTKPVQTTKPASKPTTTKPSAPSTTKPSTTKPASTTKPSNTPTSNTYAYFTASTGERIKYATYSTLTGGKCTGIKESGNRIIATYDIGANCEWTKCDNCGKYLCNGCQPVVPDKCPYCGYPSSQCMRFSKDVNCYVCGKPVKADTCHHCAG